MANPLDDAENKHILNQFLLEHAPLINLHIKKLQNEGKIPEGTDVNDLHMEGFHGLVDALHKYDPAVGASFPTYAARRIQGKILDHLAANDPVGKQVRTRVKNVANLNKPVAAAPAEPAQSIKVPAPAGTKDPTGGGL